jgi:hypothetical protein
MVSPSVFVDHANPTFPPNLDRDRAVLVELVGSLDRRTYPCLGIGVPCDALGSKVLRESSDGLFGDLLIEGLRGVVEAVE